MPKRKKGEQKTGECAYCGVIGPVTRDHVPPENLFPEPLPTNLIKVPACNSCNNGFKLDDEYFRLAIMTGIDGERFPRELEHSVQAIKKLARPQKRLFARRMLAAQKLVEVKTPTGLHLGHAPAHVVDGKRVIKVVERIVRGLFFHHTRRRLPEAHEIKAVHAANPAFFDGPEMAAVLNTMGAPHVLGNDVLVYRYSLTEGDESAGSAWTLLFFGCHAFCVLTALPENESGA